MFDGLSPAERAPLQAYLTKAMGRPVNLVAPDLYSETVARLAYGSYDFTCLGALMCCPSSGQVWGHSACPAVTSDLLFHSVFITRSGSSIHSLHDLTGKRFAFGDINSTSAHLIPYREH